MGTFNGAEAFVWIAFFFLIIPALWIAGIIYIGSRPRRLAIWTALFVLFYLGRFFVLPFAADHIGRYQLTVTIRDNQERPIPSLPIRCQAEPSLSGVGSYANRKESSRATDASGRITITAHHPHTTRLIVARPGFPENSLYLGGASLRHPHFVHTSPSPPESVRAIVLRPKPHIEGGYPRVSPTGDIDIVWTLSPP